MFNRKYTFTFDNPTKLLFGSGMISRLRRETMPGKKALLLMSAGNSARLCGAYDETVAQLQRLKVEFVEFAKIMENPTMEICEEGGDFAAENGCDFIVAIGGGAVLDASVGVSVMATNPGRLWDYVRGGSGKGQPVQSDPLPIITIATSSGTGSEMNELGVISNDITKEKIAFADRRCKPVIAVVDPRFMLTVPPLYTAYQGFDALFHHTEAMMSTGLNAMSEALALSSIADIAQYLPRAVTDGSDLEAREHVAYASTMAGPVMQLTSLVTQHAMEHAMSAYHRNVPHGAGLIMIAREFAQFLVDHQACDEAFIKMARAMGMEDASSAQDFITAQDELMKACGVDEMKMSDFGITKDECMQMSINARETMGSLYMATPCEITDEDVAGIFERSYK